MLELDVLVSRPKAGLPPLTGDGKRGGTEDSRLTPEMLP